MAMRIGTTRRSARGAWDLEENGAVALPRRRVGTVVRVHRGTVLVTQEGDRDDHVLEPGDELLLRRRGRAVAWAFTDATVSLCPATAAAPRIEPPARLRALPLGDRAGVKIAHELKNPLTAVKALVQLGLRDPAEAASHARLAVVEKEVTRMQEILSGYLSSTRPLEEVKPARVRLGPLVSDALLLLSGQASDARVRLLARGDATVEADPRRLEDALLNLVANAIEATPPGGEVVVEVLPSAGQAEIVVRDTGRGMPPETLRRLGTPFFTTREDGTGLGVALARSVIAQHGGSLRYESEPGKGTTVTVALRPPSPVDVVARVEGGFLRWRVEDGQGRAIPGRAVALVAGGVDVGPAERDGDGGRAALRGGRGSVAVVDEETGVAAVLEIH